MQQDVQSARREFRDSRQNECGDPNSGGPTVSVCTIAHHQRFRRGDAELLQRDFKESWMRLLHTMLEREPKHWAQIDWPRGLGDTIEPSQSYLD